MTKKISKDKLTRWFKTLSRQELEDWALKTYADNEVFINEITNKAIAENKRLKLENKQLQQNLDSVKNLHIIDLKEENKGLKDSIRFAIRELTPFNPKEY